MPDLRAAAAIIYNPHDQCRCSGKQNSQDQRSIASITKVMTATVFLESSPDLSQQVTDRSQRRLARRPPRICVLNDKVTADDLLHLLLIASDNAAARALARISP